MPFDPRYQMPPTDHLAHGMALGRTEAALERLIYIAEMHGRSLELVASTQARMAETLDKIDARAAAPPPTKPPEQLALKDTLQLIGAAVAALAVISGRMPLKEAIAVFGKLFGL